MNSEESTVMEARPRKRAGSAMTRIGARAGVVAFVAVLNPTISRATTIDVAGGPGLDAGAVCLATALTCPPATSGFSLVGAGATTGSYVYDPTAQTVSFNLTLTAAANFGGVELLAGSNFTGVVAVTQAAQGSGIIVTESALAFGSETINFSSGAVATASAPLISGLTCTIGTGADQCGLILGPTQNQFSLAGTSYEAQYTFNNSVVPVPLPAAAWLLLSGVGGLGFLRRRGQNPV